MIFHCGKYPANLARPRRGGPGASAVGLVLAGLLVFLLSVGGAFAQEGAREGGRPGPRIPSFWVLKDRLEKPDFSRILNIRFLTEPSYPPFNFVDEEGRLVGFNVDIARALCEELKVECIMRTRTWDKLLAELDQGKADAIIASMATTAESRERVDFTDRYYVTPARFAVRKDSPLADTIPIALADKPIAVVEGTAHEAFVQQHFSDARIVSFKTRALASDALIKGEVEAYFDDAISLSFWISGKASDGCCEFRGDAYYDSAYFGEGVSIAVHKGNDELRRALNYALRKIYRSGKYEEIYLRYFPVAFY